MSQPSVSIIVPVYNVEPYVEDCIRSVMRQTYDGPMECIVVDDCGTDNSMAIVENLVSGYNGPISFKVLHHDHNRGLSAARNTGLDAATGDYLFFLDSDDELTDDCIEKLLKPLEKEWYDVIMGNVQCYKLLPSGEQEKIDSYLKLPISDEMKLDSPMMMRMIYEWKNMTVWNRLYRADFIKQYQLQFREGLLYEDHLWSFQIACLASSFLVVPHITYYYKWRKGSISCPYDKIKYITNLIIIIKEMGGFVDKYQINNCNMYQVFRWFFNKVLNNYSTSMNNYVSIYKELRPFVKAPINYILHVNGFHTKAYFHDLHLMLPILIAPYWQYYFYRKVCSVLSLIRNR